jgi:hypothetical protein
VTRAGHAVKNGVPQGILSLDRPVVEPDWPDTPTSHPSDPGAPDRCKALYRPRCLPTAAIEMELPHDRRRRPPQPACDRADRLPVRGAYHDFLRLDDRQPWSLLSRGFTELWIHATKLAEALVPAGRRHADTPTRRHRQPHTRSRELPEPTLHRHQRQMSRHQHPLLRSVATTPCARGPDHDPRGDLAAQDTIAG